MKRSSMRWMATAMTAGVALLGAVVWAQEQNQKPAERAKPAEKVMQELLDQGRPAIEPTQRPRTGATDGKPAQPLKLDPAIIGVAPGAEAPRLRPEGQFVINRRARMVRASDGVRSILIFESDTPDGAEPPMVLLPCQLLETMENIVAERGDNVVFIISGQVTIYRGVNHLLPTMVREATDPANLRG